MAAPPCLCQKRMPSVRISSRLSSNSANDISPDPQVGAGIFGVVLGEREDVFAGGELIRMLHGPTL